MFTTARSPPFHLLRPYPDYFSPTHTFRSPPLPPSADMQELKIGFCLTHFFSKICCTHLFYHRIDIIQKYPGHHHCKIWHHGNWTCLVWKSHDRHSWSMIHYNRKGEGDASFGSVWFLDVTVCTPALSWVWFWIVASIRSFNPSVWRLCPSALRRLSLLVTPASLSRLPLCPQAIVEGLKGCEWMLGSEEKLDRPQWSVLFCFVCRIILIKSWLCFLLIM